jgi:hypothetical protein
MKAVLTTLATVVVLSINKGLVPPPVPERESMDPGLEVPIPTLPKESIIKVVLATDDEPTNKGIAPDSGFMESIAPGVLVPIPTLGNPPEDPMESMGGIDPVSADEVANERALKVSESRVEVALLAKERMPEFKENTSLMESPNRADPVISKFPVVEVEIPTPNPLATVSKDVEA